MRGQISKTLDSFVERIDAIYKSLENLSDEEQIKFLEKIIELLEKTISIQKELKEK